MVDGPWWAEPNLCWAARHHCHSRDWSQSTTECHLDQSSPAGAVMLKHKLRKSRKNILSLLEFHEEDEKRENVPEYSEIKKTGRKDKKKKGIRYTLEPILE